MSRRRWTPEDGRRILEYVAAYGPSQQGLADLLGVTLSQLHNYVGKFLGQRYRDAVESYYARMRAQREVAPVETARVDDVLGPVVPFAVPLPRPAKRAPGKPLKALVFGDTHVPYQDDGALACIEAVLKAFKPDVLIHLGDLIDAGQISEKFLLDPARPTSLKDDVKAAKAKLWQWAKLAPQAERWLFEGNHEDRLRRLLWGTQGPLREVATDMPGWPQRLQLDSIGWNWVPYTEQPARGVLPKILVKHGDIVSQWAGFTAKREWMAYGASGISGHTHRAIVWPHTDDNGVARWIEAGCTCRYDIPWATRTDWQQAVTLLEWNADRYLMNVEQALIRNGSLLWRGREYRA